MFLEAIDLHFRKFAKTKIWLFKLLIIQKLDNMIIISASFKGGVGKMTSAIHLVCYLAKKGETILIDGDSNKSAAHLGKRRKLPFQTIDLYQASMQNGSIEPI